MASPTEPDHVAPADELRAAAHRLRDMDDANWRGTPLATLFPDLTTLMDEYGADWRQCPEDHPGTRLDDAALALARAINQLVISFEAERPKNAMRQGSRGLVTEEAEATDG
ncbi:hypothetical protein ACFOOM_07680 [Streptomyces echinoruber]|uniref:Uncharacterized protein n=1 Tax=Streptomyces echinoruber TaxID=68898 RepID=A0A918VA70_9ACTN|nr:hypothetical protein [Streptomyces echinoruber]GGZ80378.1 hypothetical protein GCM10010389_17750 [Streptomyces echinoruber]